MKNILSTLLGGALFNSQWAAAEVLVKSGDKIAFLRGLAKEKNIPLADLNAMFHQAIKAANKPGTNVLISDGVHMNADGDQLLAVGVLQAFGLGAAQIDKAKSAWVPLVEAGKIAQEKRNQARKARQEEAAKKKAEKAKAAQPENP